MAKRLKHFVGLHIFSRENKPFNFFFQGPLDMWDMGYLEHIGGIFREQTARVEDIP